jgi:DNA-binding CsgD family transcriptional regulator
MSRGAAHHAMVSDVLEPSDYRLLFRVLEDVAGASTLAEFREHLLESLAKHLDWRTSTVGDGPTHAHCDGMRPGLLHTLPRAFAEEYRERWHAYEPFVSPRGVAELTEHGVVVLSDLLTSNPGGHTAAFAERLLRPHGIDDVAGILAHNSAGVLYLGVAFDSGKSIGPRERAILQKLGRFLGPLLVESMQAGYGAQQEWGFTERETQIAGLVAAGLTNRQIAVHMNISVDTVKKHLTHAMAKSQSASRTQLAIRWRPRQPPPHAR